MKSKTQSWTIIRLLLTCAAGLLLAACQPAGGVPAGQGEQVSITASDYAFEAPDSIPAGWVDVTLSNTGQEAHHVQFLQMNEGVTFEQFTTALAQGEGPALALVSLRGGVGQIQGAAGADEAVLELPAGNYVLVCFVPSPDGVPHLAKGMIKPLTVTGEAAGSEPQASTTVTLTDFAIDMPDELPAGAATLRVVNNGPQLHEWNVVQAAEGSSQEAIEAWLAAPQGPPPFNTVGGMNGLSNGLDGYLQTDFTPGQYLALCFIPDVETGAPHFALGMSKAFTVR